MNKYLSTADIAVIIITMFLFIAALFTKGFTHDLFLETGVMLVSIKIIMMNYKNITANKQILKELADIKGKMSEMSNRN
jgi:hypothetical protein